MRAALRFPQGCVCLVLLLEGDVYQCSIIRCLLLVQLLMLTSSEAIMGRVFMNTLPTNTAAWLIAAAVLAINGFLLFDFVAKDLPTNAAARTGFLACVAIYLLLVIYFAIGPQR